MSAYQAIMHSWLFTCISVVGIAFSMYLELTPSVIQLFSFYLVLFVAAARPSLEEKNNAYWAHWAKFIVIDWILFCGLVGFLMVVVFGTTFAAHLSGIDVLLYSLVASPQFWLPGSERMEFWAILFSPFLILIILFMLDAKRTFWAVFKAIGRAILMLAYNYPFFLGVYILVRLILSAGYLISSPLSPYISVGLLGWLFFFFVFYPYFICLITNFYVKRLHEQFSLYYARKF